MKTLYFRFPKEGFGSPQGVSYYTGENEGPRHSELGKLLTHSSEVSESEFSATSLAGHSSACQIPPGSSWNSATMYPET